MGRADESADDALEVDSHGRLVDGGLKRLGGPPDLLLGRLPDAVVVDGVEPKGAGHLLGLGVVGGERNDEFQRDCLAVLRGAGGLLRGLLSVLRGHDLISHIPRFRGPYACVLPPRVLFDQAGQ